MPSAQGVLRPFMRCYSVLACLAWLTVSVAHAQSPYRLEDATDEQLEARIAALDTYFLDVQRPTRAYVGGWIAALGALAIGQGVMALYQDEPSERMALIGGSAMSAAGAVVVASIPAPGRYAYKRFSRMTANNRAERIAKVRAGEVMLAGEAKSVDRSRSYWAHVAAGVVGVGISLGLGLGYDDNWDRALVSGIGALLVVEARIWTRRELGRYYHSRYKATPTLKPDLSYSPSTGRRALGLTLQFAF